MLNREQIAERIQTFLDEMGKTGDWWIIKQWKEYAESSRNYTEQEMQRGMQIINAHYRSWHEQNS